MVFERSTVKVTSITYEKLVNLGNFEHESYSLTVELDDGETPHEAFKRAQAFVAAEAIKRPDEPEIANAKKILENLDAYTGYQVREAQRIRELSSMPDEISF
jgi:hypothetical protein